LFVLKIAIIKKAFRLSSYSDKSSNLFRRAKEQNNEAVDTFSTSVGWFDRVQRHNVKTTGEEASENKDTAYVRRFEERESSL
jgi:hypothetical protein